MDYSKVNLSLDLISSHSLYGIPTDPVSREDRSLSFTFLGISLPRLTRVPCRSSGPDNHTTFVPVNTTITIQSLYRYRFGTSSEKHSTLR